jgi:hypothetical protein
LHLTESFPRVLGTGSAEPDHAAVERSETEVEVGTVENIAYTCSPFALSGAFSGAHTLVAGPWTAYAQGTGMSLAMREKTAFTTTAQAIASARTTALLPISDVVAVKVDNGFAGIRSWSPPV